VKVIFHNPYILQSLQIYDVLAGTSFILHTAVPLWNQ